MIIALAGGVGGARLARGLAACLAAQDLTIVVNVGDDFQHLGLTICPDLDTVMYTLAGVEHPEQGWGRRDETWSAMEVLAQLGGPDWFRLGDRDLGLHLWRSEKLANGMALAAITHEACQRMGVAHTVIPVTENSVRTKLRTVDGPMDFQTYFVREKCRPAVVGIDYAGAHDARLTPALQTLLESGRVRGVILCPSNPYLSILPMLAIAPLARWIHRRSVPVVAVSPLVAGQAIKGPAAKVMGELGDRRDALGVVKLYGDRVDGWVIDDLDSGLVRAIESDGRAVQLTDTIMKDAAGSERVARAVLSLLERLRDAA